MKYRHGAESVDRELLKIQLFLEFLSDLLLGTDKAGDDGMIEEWNKDRANRKAVHQGLKLLLKFASVLVAIASILVGIQAALAIAKDLHP